MAPTIPPLGRLTTPQEMTCEKCGWSLLRSGRSKEAHDATCDGLPSPPLPTPEEDPGQP